MRFVGDEIHFAPSDLTVFWESEFAAWMERWELERRRARTEVDAARLAAYPQVAIAADPEDEDALLLRGKGADHEKSTLRRMRESGDVVEIGSDPTGERTRAALAAGAAIIYHAVLQNGRFGGQPDFLVRNAAGSYEVCEAKLARSAKPEHVLQLCIYAELLAALGVPNSDHFQILLGGGSSPAQLPVASYRHYARRLVNAFLDFHAKFDRDCTPHPGATAKHGRWSAVAEAIIAATDHPRRLPFIQGAQIRKLEGAGITTRAQLATLELRNPVLARGAGFDPEVLGRLAQQARLQIASEVQGALQYEPRPPGGDGERRGLALLPPGSPLDVFFDMEGHPLPDGQLEYLFGAAHAPAEFSAWWALAREDEQAAFEGFVDWVHDRWQRDPMMHVYHYNAYETAALKRLMGTYASREDEVDDLLRNEVFVDLYRIVRQGLVIGADGYSLKDIEPLYRPARDGKVKTAAGCMAAFERWLDAPDGDTIETSRTLRDIHDYNRVDCESTRDLAAWLRRVQEEAGIAYVPPAGLAPEEEKETHRGSRAERNAARRASARALTERLESMVTEATDPEEARIGRLLSQLVEFHWRETKPVFWRRYERLAMEEDELARDLECLAGCEPFEGRPKVNGTKYEYTCRFDPEQETKLTGKDTCILADDPRHSVDITAIDLDAGTVELSTGSSLPSRFSLVKSDVVPQNALEESIWRQAEAWSNAEGPSRAVQDFLQRHAPRIRGHAGGPIVRPTESLEAGLLRAIDGLEESTLCIQGPPGTGKTYTAAGVILELLRAGRRVGVAAHAHKAIFNLMREVHARMQGEKCGTLLKIKGDQDDVLIASGDCAYVADNKDAQRELDKIEGGVLIGATAYAFARPEMQGKLDVLFVDEAGQMSVANLIAAAPSARNLVLIGDQMQLGQPLRGAHPGDSGQSALEYLLQDRATIPPELGVFLDTTYRMHPELCTFVSDAVYDGRLAPAPEATRRGLHYAGPADAPEWLRRGTGIVWRPVEHTGNAQSSPEEADVVEQVVAALLKCDYTDEKGKTRRMTLDDVLVVAPYNMQVRLLQRRLEPAFGALPRVGSVDRFQGLQAPAVVVSMCASTFEDVPRGLEFLLSKNRLNVAVSRAQCLAVVVGSPALLVTRARSLEEMKRLDLYCRLVEHAEGLASGALAR